MIIFYSKNTGEIKGTIEGRVHLDNHLDMWIGSQEENDRIVVQYVPITWFDKEGNEVPADAADEEFKPLAFTADFQPDHDQKDLFVDLDANPSKVYQYKVDLESKKLILKR